MTIEVPHLERLIADNQFDTIYHERFSYSSLGTMTRLAAAHEFVLIDVESSSTHGGMLKVYRPRGIAATLPCPSRLAPPRLDPRGPDASGVAPCRTRDAVHLRPGPATEICSQPFRAGGGVKAR